MKTQTKATQAKQTHKGKAATPTPVPEKQNQPNPLPPRTTDHR
jgi:hypothetical protein